MKTKIVMTGATGSLGTAILRSLTNEYYDVTAIVRRRTDALPDWVQQVICRDLATEIISADHINGAEIFLHLAASVGSSNTSEDIERSPTVQIAENMVDLINRSQVTKIIVMSSVAAEIAEHSIDNARPYGVQKLTADEKFRQHLRPEKKIIFLRPPAIYGPNLSGPLASLALLIKKGIPLPLKSVKTVRPYLSIDNLIDLLEIIFRSNMSQWSQLTGAAYVCCDRTPVSASELVSMISDAIGKNSRLIPVSPFVLQAVGRVTGKTQLVGSVLEPVPYETDPQLKKVLDWRPKNNMPESLWYLEKH